MITPSDAVVWIVVIAVSAFGTDRYGLPDEARHRRAYSSKEICMKAASPLSRKLSGFVAPGISVKGAFCVPMTLEGVK